MAHLCELNRLRNLTASSAPTQQYLAQTHNRDFQAQPQPPGLDGHDMSALPTDLVPSLKSSLDAFLSSAARFRITTTVAPKRHAPTTPPSIPPPSVKQQVKTLFILDSSFNPPTRAHLSMATSALHSAFEKHRLQHIQYYYPPPYRLLLLFSVHNADKSVSPATFEQRLATMYLSALDIVDELAAAAAAAAAAAGGDDSDASNQVAQVHVDVGLTKEPFYADKSAAIDESGDYSTPEAPTHVHLVGHDTFVRLLDPKYYSASPPLSALDGYFERHALRITLRASDAQEEAKQRDTWDSLSRGHLEPQGGRRAWAERIEMVAGEKASVGVSSTAVRKACEDGEWRTVEELCTGRLTTWVKDQGLYRNHVASL